MRNIYHTVLKAAKEDKSKAFGALNASIAILKVVGGQRAKHSRFSSKELGTLKSTLV
jgi:hypothetical protein